ncbi:hypothetical protein N0K71_06700 [Dellaglioa algida]|nr:hypothetical protein [Dellaglioa algida]MDK1733313.1 hypothetical protein [Dellaglioa algida]MDK1734770.1 hypothetical protein [Dellaglioa algida]
MSEIKMKITINGQVMTCYETDSNVYKALFDALQEVHMFIVNNEE